MELMESQPRLVPGFAEVTQQVETQLPLSNRQSAHELGKKGVPRLKTLSIFWAMLYYSDFVRTTFYCHLQENSAVINVLIYPCIQCDYRSLLDEMPCYIIDHF